MKHLSLYSSIAFIGLSFANASASWEARPEIVPAPPGAPGTEIGGTVFHDLDGDGRLDPDEPGVGAVKVSNGLDVVLTDAEGRYSLPVRPDMNLTVVQPAGWKVPVDERMSPQFHYIHKPGGSPKPFRFGGLPDTGPAPARVNFPLRPASASQSFSAAVIGDSQTYSNMEIGYYRDSAVVDVLGFSNEKPDLMLYVGDVVGDDLGLLDRIVRVGAAVGAPQWLVHGNHDIDYDAESDADSSDTWRSMYGPNYYAFEQGNAIFVVLDNVVYPCGEIDMLRPGREFCDHDHGPTYNGRVPEEQMEWLENLLALTPRDKLVVFAHHIPFVSFVDPHSTKHQTDNLLDIYSLVDGRQALSLSGHTHTMENHSPGQTFEGWEEAVGINDLQFRHIIAGAASGSWYQGDLNYRGVPMSFQRMGAPKGVLMMEFEGTHYHEHYLGGGVSHDTSMWLGLNTPRFRDWYDTLMEWRTLPAREREKSVPPVSINDLGDNKFVLTGHLRDGVWLTANVWAGAAENRVTVSLNGKPAMPMERTQSGTGEAVRIGAEWADPFAAQRQLAVARYAIESESGIERNQGVEAFSGSRFGPAAPQPMGRVADRNMHLWRWKLPSDLEPGIYQALVTSIDRNGKSSHDHLVFEVADSDLPLHWRNEPWKDSIEKE